jgi:FkbM family methyltransferase
MDAGETRRRLELLVDLRRELPRYARRHAAYRARSRRDPGWLDRPQVVRLSPAVDDLALEIVARDEIGRFLYLYGVWDLVGTRLVQRVLRPGMTVLDVGANIGYFSLVAASGVGPAGLVVSFEPHDGIRARLEGNVARNGLANVVVRAEAVTSSSGEVRFYRSADAGNQGISSTVAGSAAHGAPRAEQPPVVPAVRLDEVRDELAEAGRTIDLVKLDVEGAETAAFAGGAELLGAADAPLLVFEAYELEPAATLLRGHGYTVRRLVHDRRRGIRLVDGGGSDPGEPNYLAYKEHHRELLGGD